MSSEPQPGANDENEKPQDQQPDQPETTQDSAGASSSPGKQPLAASEGREQTPGERSASESEDPSSEDVLGKAKLFTQGRDGSWMEIGVGVASVSIEDEGPGTAPTFAKFAIVSLTNPNETLLCTPVSTDDIYAVQRSTIIVWSDPELGREMAASFSTEEGCTMIMDSIRQFQKMMWQSKRRGAPQNGQGQQRGEQQSNDGDDAPSPWQPKRENLPALVLAASENKHRFGGHLIEHPLFFKEISEVYSACVERNDVVGCGHICRLTLLLLSPPFNTDQRILTQFVDQEAIDATIDIVQRHLYGPEGIEPADLRRAKFVDVGGIPDSNRRVIHYLFALQTLKDLIPLLLDDGDGVSMIGMYIIRMRMGLLQDMVNDPHFLPSLFKIESEYAERLMNIIQEDTAVVDAEVAPRLVNTIGFLLELTTSIKNAMMTEEPKTFIFTELVSKGLYAFLPYVWQFGVMTGRSAVLGKCADVIQHTTTYAPNPCRNQLLSAVLRYQDAPPIEKSTSPKPLLAAILDAVTTETDLVVVQCIHDCVIACGVGILQRNVSPDLTGVATLPLRQSILRFIVEGVARQPQRITVSGSDTAATEVQPPIDDPPLKRIAATYAGFVSAMSPVPSGAASPGAASPRPTGRLSSALPGEVTPHQCLRVLTSLCKQKVVSSCVNFIRVMQESGVLEAMAAVIAGVARTSTKLRASTITLTSVLVNINDAAFLSLLVESGVIAACASVASDSRRRGNVLWSAAQNVFVAVHQSVTEKRRTLSSSSPLMSLGIGRNLSFRGSMMGDSSVSEAGSGPVVSLYLVQHVLDQHCDGLHAETIASLQRCVDEDPTRNGGDMSSAVGSTVSQGASPNGAEAEEFARVLAEFTSDLSGVGSGSIPAAADDEDPPFLLRRSSHRAVEEVQRDGDDSSNRTVRQASPSSSLPFDNSDDDDDDSVPIKRTRWEDSNQQQPPPAVVEAEPEQAPDATGSSSTSVSGEEQQQSGSALPPIVNVIQMPEADDEL